MTRLLNFLAAASLTSPSSATYSRLDQQCRAGAAGARMLGAGHTCASLQGLDPSVGYTPWTHQPHCRIGTSSKTKAVKEYCIFTIANHTSRRGFSIFTTPDLADAVIEHAKFEIYNQVESVNPSPPYVKRQLPGRGIGLIATREIKAGETIMRDIPSLILNTGGLFHVDGDARHELIWRGFLQLPAMSQNHTRALATSRGGDEIEDVAHTNAIGVTLGDGHSYGAILPELSVRPESLLKGSEKTADFVISLSGLTIHVDQSTLHDPPSSCK